jgi:hypothetical protein
MRAKNASEAEASATLLLTEVEAEIAYSRCGLRGCNTFDRTQRANPSSAAGIRDSLYIGYAPCNNRFINRQIANLDASLTAVTSRLTAAGPPRPSPTQLNADGKPVHPPVDAGAGAVSSRASAIASLCIATQ